MNNLPVEIIVGIFQYLTFRQVVRCELWNRWFKHMIRDNLWPHAVKVNCGCELRGLAKYRLNNLIQPDVDDLELVYLLAGCRKVKIATLNSSTIKFLDNVEVLKVGHYGGSLDGLAHLVHAKKICFKSTEFKNPLSDLIYNQLDIGISQIYKVTIAKDSGQIISNQANFFDHTISASLFLPGSNRYSGMLYCFDKINKLRIYLGDKVSGSELGVLANSTEIHLRNYVTDSGETDSINLFGNAKKLRLDKSNITDNVFRNLKFLNKLKLHDCNSVTGQCFSYLKNLNSLHIFKCQNITNNSLRAIGAVCELSIRTCNRIGTFGIKHLSRVKKLTLELRFPIDNDTMRCLENVEFLKLINCRIQSSKFNVLSKLRTLKLVWCNQITDNMFQNMPNVTNISLSDCGSLTNAIFVQMSNLSKVKILSCRKLTSNMFQSIGGVKELCTDFAQLHPADLALLNCDKMQLTRTFLTSTHLEKLRQVKTLVLDKCDIVDFKGVIYMASIESITLVRWSKINSKKMEHFCAAKKLIVESTCKIKGKWFSGFKNLEIFKHVKHSY